MTSDARDAQSAPLAALGTYHEMAKEVKRKDVKAAGRIGRHRSSVAPAEQSQQNGRRRCQPAALCAPRCERRTAPPSWASLRAAWSWVIENGFRKMGNEWLPATS